MADRTITTTLRVVDLASPAFAKTAAAATGAATAMERTGATMDAASRRAAAAATAETAALNSFILRLPAVIRKANRAG